MPHYNSQELHRLSELSLDDLYIELFSTSEEGKGVLGSPGAKRFKGQKAFEKHRTRIQQVVCKQWKGCDRLDRFEDITKLIAAIAPLLAPQVPELSALIVATIVVKIGISVFCDCKKK